MINVDTFEEIAIPRKEVANADLLIPGIEVLICIYLNISIYMFI
jgi:hypothetical protein